MDGAGLKYVDVIVNGQPVQTLRHWKLHITNSKEFQKAILTTAGEQLYVVSMCNRVKNDFNISYLQFVIVNLISLL